METFGNVAEPSRDDSDRQTIVGALVTIAQQLEKSNELLEQLLGLARGYGIEVNAQITR